MKNLILGTLGAALTLFVVTANATDARYVEKSQVVAFDDLDLNRDAGAATLYGRLRNAAKEVCQPDVDRYYISAWAGYGRCVDETIANAVAKVDNKALTAYAANKARAFEDS